MLTRRTPPLAHSWRLCLAALFTLSLFGCGQQAQPPTPTLPVEAGTPPAPSQDAVALAGMLQDTFIFSLDEGGSAHLFAYSPQALPLTRLTDGQWDDITPALSPNGRQIAFASRRNGYWDLYLLELATGQITRLTDSREYDAAPTWSPDGRWLAYETYLDDNLEIVVLSVDDLTQPPIRLTNDPAADHSPAWAPQGRQIAFVSTRAGKSDVWLADLDRTGDERYTNLTPDMPGVSGHPTWSPDGQMLAYAWNAPAFNPSPNGIYVWDAQKPDLPAHWIGAGDWPAWNRRGDQLAAFVPAPNQNYFAIYTVNGDPILPLTPLAGRLRGLAWQASLSEPLPDVFRTAAARTPTALWFPAVTPLAEGPSGRWAIVPLEGVQAPYPRLHDLVDEAFAALRGRVAEAAGWDAMANLQNAYIPLTVPLDPGQGEDWLYTGRAFALNSITLSIGWLAAMREDFGQQTYWRLYLRAQAQDGSQGEPLHDLPWDLNARYNLDPKSYEQGGQLAENVPPGYWVDFTSLASQYGWERLPALTNWRAYFNGTRFTEFMMTGGLDWETAMLEIYPADIFITPTVIILPTRTPTRTPRDFKAPTPSLTPSPRPTFTPSP